jgi:alkylation response protein AidB-like acyl-CoA dehydrogenase
VDVRDSEKEAAFRSEARAFLDAQRANHPPDLREAMIDERRFLDRFRAWQEMLFEHGWASITWPKQYGGRGLGPTEQIIWNQELARVGISESPFLQAVSLAGPTIIAHGNDAQKARHLEPILRGREIWCQLFSEPGAGSDLASLATRAERSGDDWIVSGQKTWCSGGHRAAWGILIARTDPSVPKHRGITYFLVDMHSPGVEVRPLPQIDGSVHFNEVFLNEVRVPDANRLGPEGSGWQVTMTTLMNERMAIGGMGRLFSFESLVEAARANPQRVDAVMRDELARLYTWTRILDLLNARVITKLGRGAIPDAEGSVIKLVIARTYTKAAELGMRLVGPEAMLSEGEWPHHFLMAPALHIGGGTDEIQKNVCAERVLGLPRESRADRDVPFQDLPRS